jgi:hypothetical protein
MLARTLAIAFGLAGAVAASQAPEFAQQYVQRLGGAVDELRVVVERFDRAAREAGLDRERALGRLEANADRLARRQGEGVRDDLRRFEALAPHYEAMRTGSAATRAFEMLRADGQIAARAFRDFQPALPVTAAGAVAAAIGFALGAGLVYGGRAGARRLKKLRKRAAEPKPARRSP